MKMSENNRRVARASEVTSKNNGKKITNWKSFFGILPSLGFALLPKIACPACWPAYAGILSSFGVTFLIDTRYLFAMTAGFLVIALFFLGFRAKRRRGYAPFLLGVSAAFTLLAGKFYFENDTSMYVGVIMLMAASLWNSWPRKAALTGCSACAEPKNGATSAISVTL